MPSDPAYLSQGPSDPVRIIGPVSLNSEDTARLAEIEKLDDAASDGLSGVNNSIAYRLGEIERHLHSYERWFGIAIAPTATHLADRIGTAIAPFQIDAGNNTWGAWVQILGSADTPATPGRARYDLHRLMIVAAERGLSHHFIQVGFGVSGAAALLDGTYTEFVYRPQSGAADESPIDIQVARHPAGQLAWARVFIPGQNTGTVDFFLGLHEYEG